MIWVCADWHFNHNQDFVYKARGFDSVEQMNQAIINNHNSLVRPDDDVYVLGDLMLGADAAAGIELIKKLNGDLHIVYGNHDTDRKKELYKQLPNFVEGADALTLKYRKYHFYLSHYPTITSNNDYDKTLRQRLLNICGHTHTKNQWEDFNKGYIYHAEMEAHDCNPVGLDQIINDFENKILPSAVRQDTIVAAKYLFKRTKCDKCVYSYGYGCPGPINYPFKCPDDFTYKRDPPDGGYYG